MNTHIHLFSKLLLIGLLLQVSLCLHAQDKAVIFVSAQTGSDEHDGKTWTSAVATLDHALTLAETRGIINQGINAKRAIPVYIYMAEGTYDAPQKVSGRFINGTYTMMTEGQSITLTGGFAKPNATTLPTDTLGNVPRRYITEISPTVLSQKSLFVMSNDNQSLLFRGLRFASDNIVGNNATGAVYTCNAGADNPYLEVSDCIFEHYRSGNAGVFYFNGSIANPKIKIRRVEVLKGEPYGTGNGGGFLASSNGGPANAQIDISYLTMHDVTHRGSATSDAIVGFSCADNKTTNTNPHITMDHVQVKGNKDAGLSGSMPLFVLYNMGSVRVTNSSFNHSIGGVGGCFYIRGFHTVYSENNQFYECTGRNVGGVMYLLDNGSFNETTVDGQPVAQRTVTFKNDEFYGNRTERDGGAIAITGTSSRLIDVTIENCNFENNYGKLESGAVWLNVVGNVTVKNSMFCGNTGNWRAGAIFIKANPNGLLTVDGCYFSENTDNKMGSGAIFTEVPFDIKNCLFLNNKSTGTELGSDSKGGAISAEAKARGSITNCKFVGNWSVGNGGAIFTSGDVMDVKLSNNFFQDNKAGLGGALYNKNAASKITMNNNQFMGNEASNGGAVFMGEVNTFVSDGDIYNKNAATGVTDDSGVGGAIRVGPAASANIKITNAKFVSNVAKNVKGGGALWINESGKYIVDELSNSTFYNNQAYDSNTTLSATASGADISTNERNCFFKMSGCNVQLAKDVYGSNLVDVGNNNYSQNTPIDVPEGGNGPLNPDDFNQTDCKPIIERPEIDVTTPHPEVTTSEVEPTHYKTYAKCDTVSTKWVKFESESGQGPFTFTYDVFKTVNATITKLNVDPLTVRTGTDATPVVDPETGETSYVRSVTVDLGKVFPDEKFLEGNLYTVICTKVTDANNEEFPTGTIDYANTRTFPQMVGAQIFIRDCTPRYDDLDYDNDGIRNDVECEDLKADNLEQKVQTGLTQNQYWSVPFVTSPKTSDLFASIVRADHYLNIYAYSSTQADKVLTVNPGLLGKTAGNGGSGDYLKKDISTNFKLPEGSVIVEVFNYQFDDGFFITSGTGRTFTRWKVSGRANPYILMQSTPISAFSAGTEFGINILDNKDVLSQTAAYTDLTKAGPQGSYTVYETNTYKKVLFNTDGSNLLSKVGLSYLNIVPGDKYFEFEQSDRANGVVRTAVTIVIPCDTDKDGVPNVLDLDSDGDGCLDAIEGDQFITVDQLKDGAIDSEEDENGIPELVKGGQGLGASQNAEVKAGCSLWIGGIDTDYTNVENWGGKYIPVEGEDLVFATEENNGAAEMGNTQVGPAVRDMVIPAGKFLNQAALVNEAPNKKYVGTDKTKTPGHPAVVVTAGAGLTVTSAKGFETPADADKMVLKASEDNSSAPGTFVMNRDDACDRTVHATVEMKPLGRYIPKQQVTDTDPNSPDYNKPLYAEFDWQYIGVPVESVTKNPTFSGMKLRAYDETLNDPDHFYRKWKDVQRTDAMTAFRGYEIAPVLDESGKVITDPSQVRTVAIAGKLNFCDAELTLTRRAAEVTASKATDINERRYGLGYNIFGNSFAAGVNINDIEFADGGDGVKPEETVYLYTTGSFKDWAQQQGNTGSTAKGGYQAVPKGKAGQDGLPATIPPMQGFMVKYANPTYSETDGKLTIPYAGKVSAQTDPQRAKPMMSVGAESGGVVMVTLDDGKVYDVARLYEDSGSTEAYDAGYDAEKLNLGAPSVFATTTDDRKVQISSLSTIDGMTFGVQTERGTDYTMSLEARRLDYPELKLVDRVAHSVTPFADGKVDYFFTGDVTGFEDNRFLLVNTVETDYDAVMNHVTDVDRVEITLGKGRATVYTLSGKKVGDFRLPLDADTLRGKVPAGVYLIKATDGQNVESRKIVVK
ncbi:MAG: T9SS type A sorting domain-containing protein [Prevotella sp.]